MKLLHVLAQLGAISYSQVRDFVLLLRLWDYYWFVLFKQKLASSSYKSVLGIKICIYLKA